MRTLDKALLLQQPVSTIAGASPEDLSDQLEAALAALDPAEVRVVRLGNLLRLPLTLKRLLLQISALDEHSQTDEAAVANVLGRRLNGERHVVLVIEHADSLDPDAMQFLRTLAESFTGRVPSLHVLLAGSLGLLDLPSGQPEPSPGIAAPDGSGPGLAIPPPPASRPPSVAARPAGRPRRLGVLVAFGLALCLAAGAALTVRPSVTAKNGPLPAVGQGSRQEAAQAAPVPSPADQPPRVPARSAAPSALDAATAELPAAPAPAASAVPVEPLEPLPSPREEDTARLRADFRRFLARSGRSRTALTNAQRDALFNDYLEWRARQASEPPR